MSSFDIPSPRSNFVEDGRITREWNMFLRNVFARIGGSSGDSSDALRALIDTLTQENGYRQIENAFPPIPASISDIQEPLDLSARMAELGKLIEEIRIQFSMLPDPSAVLAELRKIAATSAANLGFFSATTSAQLAGILTDETGTGSAVFHNTPTLATPNIVGVTTASNALAGSVGEYLTASAAGVALSTAVVTNIASISLTAGDWDVVGNILFQPSGTTTTQITLAGISTTSAAFPAVPFYAQSDAAIAAGLNSSLMPPTTRINVSTTTIVYLVGQANFLISTMAASGYIAARRRR
jgi:hypothetical protein